MFRALAWGLRPTCTGLAGLAAAAGSAPMVALSSTAATAAVPLAAAASASASSLRGLASLRSSFSSFAASASRSGACASLQAGSSGLASGSVASSGLASGSGGSTWRSSWAAQQLVQARPRTTSSHLKVEFAGGKIKPYSSYKSRFRVTGSGKVLYARPGHVHKRFSKSKRQLFDLSQYQTLTPRYAKTVKKIGFKMRKL